MSFLVVFGALLLFLVSSSPELPRSLEEIIAKHSTGDVNKTRETLRAKLGEYEYNRLGEKRDPDVGLSLEALVYARGYPLESYFVTTEDGYVLRIYRIPYGRNESSNARNSGKPPVIVNHGFEDSQFTWLNNAPYQSLGYILADNGYDVWLTGNRGSFFNFHHVDYKKHTTEFWNFTYDEMAKYDAPANIDFVLTYTNNTQVAWIGHSEGTTQIFAMSTVRPEYREKISFFGALAPVAYLRHCKSLLLRILADLDIIVIFELFGDKQFFPFGINKLITKFLGPLICTDTPDLCYLALELILGPSGDINTTRLGVYMSELPAGSSVKNTAHWSQGITSRNFQMFDYGSKSANEEHYGQSTPPLYYLSNHTIPTVFYSGGNDYLADPEDVKDTINDCPSDSVIDHIEIKHYAHMDFTWGENAYQTIYPDILNRLQTYVGNGKKYKKE